MQLRHRLLQLECELLAELRSLLESAPNPTAFQLKWGQLTPAGRETFYNQHFLSAIRKIRLAIAAFLVDLILAQETDAREHFLAYTVAQQAKELSDTTATLRAQLALIKDANRVQEVTTLNAVCNQFRLLLQHLAAPPHDTPKAA